MQQLGGAIFVSVGQNIFSNELVDRLFGVAGLEPQVIVNTGATDLRRVVPPNEIDAVVEAYSYSLTRVFLLAAVLNAITLLGAVFVESKSIKKGKNHGDTGKGVASEVEKGTESGDGEEKREI